MLPGGIMGYWGDVSRTSELELAYSPDGTILLIGGDVGHHSGLRRHGAGDEDDDVS